jgi:RNA polymerase-associated protein RTF1
LVAFNLTGPTLNQKLAKQKRFQGELNKQAPPPAPNVDPKAEEKRLKAEANRKKYLEAQEAQKAARMQEKARQRAAALEAEKLRQEAKAKMLKVPKSNLDELFEGGSDLSRVGTPQPGEKKDGEKETKPVRETINGIPTFHRKKMDDEVIASIDLGIDIEI